MVTKIIGGKIIAPDSVLEGYSLYFEGGSILAITKDDLPFNDLIDAGGKYVSPGFIDIHTHGGGGFDFMDGGIEPIIGAANFHMEHGTTTIFPTSLACSTQTLLDFLSDAKQVIENGLALPSIPGVHLEGPYFNLAQAGAQNPDYIIDPDPKVYNKILSDYSSIVSRWDFAPERNGSVEFCKSLKSAGVVPAIAHSNAQKKHIDPVYESGCKLITHLYSAMSSIVREDGYRKLGVIETAYLYDDIDVEMIADGRHLPVDLMRIIIRGKGYDHICLVTDSMRGAGSDDGVVTYLGRMGEAMECVIDDGVAKLPDRSAFAGSVATADRLVRVMVKDAGVSMPDAIKMITATPARVMGLTKKGALKVGYDADIVIFDDDINIAAVICRGVKTK